MMREALDDLVQCAVAAAGEDEVSAMADCVGSLRSSGSGAVGCDDFNLDIATEKHVRGAPEQAKA
jgi:hypothetical protein